MKSLLPLAQTTAGLIKEAHDPGDPLITSHCLPARSAEAVK
jgi:hypothetical protein